MTNKLFGTWGEEKAAKFLQDKGYKIIGMNYKNRFGEIDIIAERKKLIIFVEVKTRRDDNFASAMEYVDDRKKVNVVTVAGMWLVENNIEAQPRFDVIEVYAPNGTDTDMPRINHIMNAFGAKEHHD